MHILFSPVGSNDPYSNRVAGTVGASAEGSLLTVLRGTDPDAVFLFYNKDVEGDMEQAALDTCDIITADYPDTKVELLPQEGLAEPHIYDAVYPLLDNALSAIRSSAPDAKLVLNVSSGTPAIKAALIILHTLDAYSTEAYQVSDRGETRVSKFEKYYSLANEIQRDNIRTLIRNYDYGAAAQLAKRLNTVNPNTPRFIKACMYRLNLDNKNAKATFSSTPFAYSEKDALCEYLQTLQVMLAREQWSSFVRALTPAITQTLYDLLEPHLSKDKYLSVESGDFTSKLDWNKIDNDGVLSKVLRQFPGSPEYINNRGLFALLDKYYPEKEVIEELRMVDRFESGVRNKIAHNINYISKEWIHNTGRMTMQAVLDTLCKYSKVTPDLYKRINQYLLDIL